MQWGGAPKAEFLFAEQRWPPDVLVALQENEMSKAAGEGYGAVVMADAVLTELETATQTHGGLHGQLGDGGGD